LEPAAPQRAAVPVLAIQELLLPQVRLRHLLQHRLHHLLLRPAALEQVAEQLPVVELLPAVGTAVQVEPQPAAVVVVQQVVRQVAG
jgi:hypothetical protein